MRTKKVIAREGLVVLGTIGLGMLLISLALHFRPSLEDIFDGKDVSNFPYGKMIDCGRLLIIAYPLYLLIRFITWAIKTLKEK